MGVAQAALKKANYEQLPSKLVKQEAPKKDENKWQEFHKKLWLPIAIHNADGSIAKLPSNKKPTVNMVLRYINEDYKPIEPAVIPTKIHKDNLFYFKHITAFVFGEIEVSITLDKDCGMVCEPFVQRITIEVDEEGNTDTGGVGGAAKKSAKKTKAAEAEAAAAAAANKKERRKAAGDTTVGKKRASSVVSVDDEVQEGKRSKKASAAINKRSNSVKSEDGAAAAAAGEKEGADEDEKSAPRGRKRQKKAKPEEADSASGTSSEHAAMDDWQLMSVWQLPPNTNQISVKNRFYRWPLEDENGEPTDKRVAKLRIDGPQQWVSLPPSLLSAILDDKVRVAIDARQHAEEKEQGVRRTSVQRAYVGPERQWLNRPTVNEIFRTLVRGTIQTEGMADIVRQLQHLFEFCFEDNILYADERPVLQELVNGLKDDEEKFADHFGPVYFLRFLLLFTSLADTMASEEDNAASRGTDRSNQAMFLKSQVLLHLCIRELDENSVAYFG